MVRSLGSDIGGVLFSHGHKTWIAWVIALALVITGFILRWSRRLGFAVHLLWIVLVIAILLWLIGFFIGGAPVGGGRRRWYGRW